MPNLLAVLSLVLSWSVPVAGDAAGAIVSTEWLSRHLDDPSVRVIVTGDRGQYERGHVPGARFVEHMETLGDRHRLLAPAALASVLSKAGAAAGARIVLYGDDPMSTGWLFMALASIGHADTVSMLEGGIELWKAQKRPTSSAVPPPGTGSLSVRAASDVGVDAAWVRARLSSPDTRVLDVRSTREWNGGHLPGATLVLWQELFADLEAQKLKSPDEIRALFARAGVREGQQVVTYCAIGMRASLMYWAARSVGLPARVYAGSYEDWRRDSGNPIVKDQQ